MDYLLPSDPWSTAHWVCSTVAWFRIRWHSDLEDETERARKLFPAACAVISILASCLVAHHVFYVVSLDAWKSTRGDFH